MRALLAGPSGVNKDLVVANLLACLRRHDDDTPADGDAGASAAGASESTHSTPDDDLFVASVEDEFARQGGDLPSTLAAFRPRYQLDAWQRAGQHIARRLESLDPRHTLITAHLTYYTSGRQFSLLDIPTVRRWRPDCIITLVDDMLDIHAALQAPRCRPPHPLPAAPCAKSWPGAPPKSQWATSSPATSTSSAKSPTMWSASSTRPKCCAASSSAAASTPWCTPASPSPPCAIPPSCAPPLTPCAPNSTAASSSLTP